MNSNGRRGLILLLLLPLKVALLFSPLSQAAQVVSIEPVTKQSWSDQLEALGTVAARDQVTLTSKVDGFVEQLSIADGQHVKAGQALIELDHRLETAHFAEAEASLQEELRRLKELEQLIEKRAVSESELAAQEALVAQSKAQLQAASATLSYYTIKAPFSGVLGLHQISPGQYIQPGQELVRLTNLDSLYVDFSLPGRNLGRIKPGMKVSMTFDAWPGRTFETTVSTIDTVIDPQSRNFVVRSELDNSERLLNPGLLARVTLDLGAQEMMTVQTSSLFYRGQQAYVFRVDENNKAYEQAVTTGAIRGSTTVIADGLEPGDRVVTIGVAKVSDGAQVKTAGAAQNVQGAR